MELARPKRPATRCGASRWHREARCRKSCEENNPTPQVQRAEGRILLGTNVGTGTPCNPPFRTCGFSCPVDIIFLQKSPNGDRSFRSARLANRIRTLRSAWQDSAAPGSSLLEQVEEMNRRPREGQAAHQGPAARVCRPGKLLRRLSHPGGIFLFPAPEQAAGKLPAKRVFRPLPQARARKGIRLAAAVGAQTSQDGGRSISSAAGKKGRHCCGKNSTEAVVMPHRARPEKTPQAGSNDQNGFVSPFVRWHLPKNGRLERAGSQNSRFRRQQPEKYEKSCIVRFWKSTELSFALQR